MLLSFSDLKNEFTRVLLARGVATETADACAEMFARTTESGVYSHGVNRFPRFIQQLENGDIIPEACQNVPLHWGQLSSGMPSVQSVT